MKPILPIFFISLNMGIASIFGGCGNDEPGTKKSHGQDSIVKELTVTGISCHKCKASLESKLKAQQGIEDAQVFLHRKNNNVRISYDPKVIPLDKIKKVIENTGKRIID